MNRTEHLLTIAGEECAETAQRISKALRFGLDQVQEDADDQPQENPERLTNRERIRREFLDLVAAMEMLGFDDFIESDSQDPDVIARMKAKKAKVERYLERSRRTGALS